MTSESKLSPNERLMRKRLAARLRQQRCRARKKELSLAKKHRDQQDAKGTAHVPVQARKPVLVARNHAAPTISRVYSHPSAHRPHQPHQPHKPHQPHQPHRPHRPHLPHHHAHRAHPVHRIHRQHPPLQALHIPLPPPPHHRQPHYVTHRPVHPLFMTEPPTKRQSIGSVVSFDDGTCPSQKLFDAVPPSAMYLKQENLFKPTHFQLPIVPTVSPTMSSKPVVEPDTSALQVPSRSPTKEETAIDAMLSLRTASFGA